MHTALHVRLCDSSSWFTWLIPFHTSAAHTLPFYVTEHLCPAAAHGSSRTTLRCRLSLALPALVSFVRSAHVHRTHAASLCRTTHVSHLMVTSYGSPVVCTRVMTIPRMDGSILPHCRATGFGGTSIYTHNTAAAPPHTHGRTLAGWEAHLLHRAHTLTTIRLTHTHTAHTHVFSMSRFYHTPLSYTYAVDLPAVHRRHTFSLPLRFVGFYGFARCTVSTLWVWYSVSSFVFRMVCICTL